MPNDPPSPLVTLQSVGFFWPGGEALPLRRNESTPLRYPEWQAQGDASEPVAYSLAGSAQRVLRITAALHSQALAGRTVQVRAVLPEPPPSAASSDPWTQNLWEWSWYESHGILGTVLERYVTFEADGDTDDEVFQLVQPRLWARGVGFFRATWLWQYRLGPGYPWHDVATTTHPVYVTVAPPTLPWLTAPLDPGNTQLLWSEVLDYACRIAQGAFSLRRAASAITAGLFAEGGERFRYSCADGSPTNYALWGFDCTEFLERLGGGLGRGPFVNCTDCATAVSTFANALGCNLWQAQMFDNLAPFAVNPIRLIGAAAFAPVCGSGLFNYHEVAWEGACAESNDVYDACLQVLAPAPPAYPYAAFVPAETFFGYPGQGGYRDLLAAPFSRPLCRPQPWTRKRRFLY